MPHVSSKKKSNEVNYVSTRDTIIDEKICIRVLPVSPFSPCDAPGVSRYPHPEGEPCILYTMHCLLYVRYIIKNENKLQL